MMKIQQIKTELSKSLSEHRYTHTLGVAESAVLLAKQYEQDQQKAEIAGLLHDCGKVYKGKEYVKPCQEASITITASEVLNPDLLHAKYSAYLAFTKYGISDTLILDAIRYHTTGRPDMSGLEKIIYVADFIEPNRKPIPGMQKIRQLAFIDLNKTVALILQNTLAFLKFSHREIDEITCKASQYYQNYL